MVPRKTVMLSDDEQAAVAALTSPSEHTRAVLSRWADDHGVSLGRESESAVLRALVQVGLESVRQAQLEAGYRALAQESGTEARAEARAARARQVKRAEAG
jgi:hypothetical protein